MYKIKKKKRKIKKIMLVQGCEGGFIFNNREINKIGAMI